MQAFFYSASGGVNDNIKCKCERGRIPGRIYFLQKTKKLHKQQKMVFIAAE
jgi:hypothetical protein